MKLLSFMSVWLKFPWISSIWFNITMFPVNTGSKAGNLIFMCSSKQHWNSEQLLLLPTRSFFLQYPCPKSSQRSIFIQPSASILKCIIYGTEKKRLRLKLGFYFQNKSCFCRPVLDYGDVSFMLPLHNVFKWSIQWTMCPWASLPVVELWLTAVSRLDGHTICVFTTQKNAGQFLLCSQDFFVLSIPEARTQLGKRAFWFSAPST